MRIFDKLVGFLFVFVATSVSNGLAQNDAGPRQHLSFDYQWSFSKGETPNAQAVEFDDKAWRKLDVPHDWSIEGPYDQANPSGGQGGYLPDGMGWYRKHFATPASFNGKLVTIQFDGIYMNADVYLNGHQIAHQPYGYTSFTAKLSSFAASFFPLPKGKDNVVAKVHVDNTAQPNSRWYTGSGIYRHVWVDVTNPVHIDPWGIYVTTPKVAADSAEVQIRTKVSNGTMGIALATVRQELLDPTGKSAGTAETAQPINRMVAAEGSEIEFSHTVTVPTPQLWSLDKPNLYSVRTTVSSA